MKEYTYAFWTYWVGSPDPILQKIKGKNNYNAASKLYKILKSQYGDSFIDVGSLYYTEGEN